MTDRFDYIRARHADSPWEATGGGGAASGEWPDGMIGKGLHLSTFQLNLGGSIHCQTANQRIPQ